jgi:CheY-like chemotaxis protein
MGRRRILIADDNRDFALSLAVMLKLMGNVTQTAHDGLEAVEAAAAFHPDVILLDIGMPRLNGYDAARRIRSEPWGKSILMVAITGWGQDEDMRQSHEAGFDHHLVKPVEPATLEKLLANRNAGTS